MKKIKIGNGAATNSVLLMFVHMVTTVLGIVVTKLLSVHFSLEEYGTYAQALLVTTTATNISILGLTNATNYFYNRTDDVEEQKRFVSTIFLIECFVGILCALVIVCFRTPIALYFGNPSLTGVLLIVALTPIMTNMISMYQVLFVSIGEAKKIAGRNFIISVVRLGAVVFSCFVIDNIITVLLAILVMDVAQIVYFSFMFKRDKFSIKLLNADLKLIKEILIFSIPMAIYVLSNSLSRDMDKYVVSAFADTSTLAIYTNAAKILPFDMLTSSLITVLVPIITRYINQKSYDSARRVFRLYLRMGFMLTSIFVGGAIAVSKYLMLFLYDVKYMVGLPVFVVYLFVDLIRFANLTTILSGSGKTKTLMVISLITLCANAVLNVCGYKLMGMIGPAIVTLVLTFLMTLALLWFGAKEIKSSIAGMFDFKEMGIVGLEIIIFGIGVHYLANFLDSIQVPLFLILAITYGGYTLALLGLSKRQIIRCFKELNTYK